MDSTDELIKLADLDGPTLKNILQNRSMFQLISAGGSEQFYLYIRGFFHARAKYPYQFRHTLREGSGYCLLYTVDGEGLLTFEDHTQQQLSPHTLCFWPYRETAAMRIIAPHWDHYLIFIDGREAEWFFDRYKKDGSCKITVPSHSKLPEMLTAYEQHPDFYQNSPFHRLCYLTSLLSEIVTLDCRPSDEESIPKYLTAIRQLFDNNYSQYYSLDLLEKEFHINKYKLAKEFTRYFGISPINYLTKRRIEAAKKLLLTTTLKINEISLQTGYENTTHFINSFKKQTGMTPSAYRKDNSNIF